MEKRKEHMFKILADAENKITDGPKTELFSMLDRLFLAIIRVDLKENTACIKQNADFPEIIDKNVIWTEYLKDYRDFMGAEPLDSFLPEKLLEIYRGGSDSFARDICYMKGGSSGWVTMEAFFDEEDGKVYATITVRQNNTEHLQKSIIHLYAYHSCDYFIYLDARNNSYMMFGSSDSKTALPPAVCDDYSAEIIRYADEFAAPEDRERVKAEMRLDRVLEKLNQGETHSFTCGIIDEKHEYARKRLEYRYYNRFTQMILLICKDITDVYMDARRKQEELQQALELACMDSLTKVLNHQAVIDRVSEYIQKKDARGALLVIDLDNFKSINDSFGHTAGDRLLCRIAEVLKGLTGSDDLVGRIGGDEFLVFFGNIYSKKEIIRRGQQICDAIYRISFDSEYKISSSIGIAVFPEEGTDYETLMKHADMRAYRAKFEGKNQIVFL